MAQVINTNSLSLITQNNINKNQSALSSSIERLSSGLRINSAKDDAAGQAIANRFTSNIKGLTQAARNANDGISLAQTTEGALSEINNNLQRVRELTVQATTGTNSDSDLSSIQDEIKSRLSEIDRVSGQTQFNGVNVLAKDGTMKIQVGANDGQTISIDLQKIDSSTLGLNGFSVSKNALETGEAITQLPNGAGAPIAVKMDASVLNDLNITDASAVSLHNVTKGGNATSTYVVQYGDKSYAASVAQDGTVKLNKADVTYNDKANGVADATQTGSLVHVLFIRQGKVLGSRSYFPKVPGGTEMGEVVETFVGQFYLQGSQMRTLPSEILLDFTLDDKTLLADSLSELAGRRVNVQTKPRGDRARYLKLARTNAATALTTKLSQQSTVSQRLTALATLLKLPEVKRMECFDISHTMGEQTVASCVVFDANGPLRAEYRRYNITGITPGDDYAAMNQVLRRRYGKAIEESKIPDVILIDGGKGQLGQAKAVFESLDVEWDKNHPLLLGVAKGADRKAGLETLFFEPEGEGFSLPPDSPALHVIQHIRDESHDHAISGHRKKRAKVKNTSTLETIEGVGPKRRQMLLKYMGGLQGLLNASMEEIAKVPGISQGLAEKIYYSLKH